VVLYKVYPTTNTWLTLAIMQTGSAFPCRNNRGLSAYDILAAELSSYFITFRGSFLLF